MLSLPEARVPLMVAISSPKDDPEGWWNAVVLCVDLIAKIQREYEDHCARSLADPPAHARKRARTYVPSSYFML